MNDSKNQKNIFPPKKIENDFVKNNSIHLKLKFNNTFEEFVKVYPQTSFPEEGCVYLIYSKNINQIETLYNKLSKTSKKYMPKINKKKSNDRVFNVLYVGKSLKQKSIKKRLKDHFQKNLKSTTWGLKLGAIKCDKNCVIKIAIYTIKDDKKSTKSSTLENILAYFELYMHDLYSPLFGKK